jgi:hypothetical protein
MAKILLTGMSAPQTSEKTNKTSKSFASVVNTALESAGNTVIWGDPDINFTKEMVDSFDSILVGISPLNSLGANRAYGALGVISSVLKHAPEKLTLFIDAPNISQIEVSLKGISSSPELLVKDFYSYRKDYLLVKSNKNLQEKLLSVVETLLNDEWPATIYPSLPWKYDTSVAAKLPKGAALKVSGVSLDSFLLEPPLLNEEVIEKWCADDPNSKWVVATARTLGLPCMPMKHTKGSTDSDVEAQIARSAGVLIAPDKKQDTWWSYRYIQALNNLTPIATNWKETHVLGPHWAVLAATIESSTNEDRVSIAAGQRISYEKNTPDKLTSVAVLTNKLRISKEK